MVVLNRIYTRTGDSGTAQLASGERRSKADLRFEAIGAVDELNAHAGLARLSTAMHPAVDATLMRVQNDLFDLGADLATIEARKPGPALRIVDTQVGRLEAEIDGLNADLSPLRSFVLPGGTPAAAALHLCRTVCRRAERNMVALAGDPAESVAEPALRYINRLSDLFFVAARWVNDRGKADVLWVPGANR